MSKNRNIADLGSNDVLETTASGVSVTGTVATDRIDITDYMSVTYGSMYAEDNMEVYGNYLTKLGKVRDGAGWKDAIVIENSQNLTQDLITLDAPTNIGGNLEVTGTATMDGLTVDGGDNTTHATFGGGRQLSIKSEQLSGLYDDAIYKFDINSTVGVFKFSNATNTKDLLKLDYNGDISFYEDTGTTSKFFWDASAESLGIGTTSPSSELSVSATSTPEIRLFESATSTAYAGIYTDANGSLNLSADGGNAGAGGSILRAYVDGTERMRITSAGNVGIGTSSPSSSAKLDVNGIVHASGYHTIDADDTEHLGGGISFFNNYPSRYAYIAPYYSTNSSGNATQLLFGTNTGGNSPAERMRIDDNGNIVIGTSHTERGMLTVDSHQTTRPNASAGSATAWNAYGQSNIKLVNNNNSMVLGVDYTTNIRTGWIQTGHLNAQYASSLGDAELALQPVGGRVVIGHYDSAGAVPLTVQGAGGAATGTSSDTLNRASLRIGSSRHDGNSLGTGTSIFMGIEDSATAWIQAQHSSDNTEKVLKLNPAGGAVAIPLGALTDENLVDMHKNYWWNWGSQGPLTHYNQYLGTTGDPSAAYVLVCRAYEGTLKNADFAMGRIYRQRGASYAGNITTMVEYYVQSAYGSSLGGGVRYGASANNSIVTCDYNGAKYIAISLNNASASYISCDSYAGGTGFGGMAPILVDDSAVSNVVTIATLIT